jgi:hypothetical protein
LRTPPDDEDAQSPFPVIAAHTLSISLLAAGVCRASPVMLGWYACGPEKCAATATGRLTKPSSCITIVKESVGGSLLDLIGPRTGDYVTNFAMEQRWSMAFQLLFASACLERYGGVRMGNNNAANVGWSRTDAEHSHFMIPEMEDGRPRRLFKVKTFGRSWFWSDLNGVIVGDVHSVPDDNAAGYKKRRARVVRERDPDRAMLTVRANRDGANIGDVKDSTFGWSALDLLWGLLRLADPDGTESKRWWKNMNDAESLFDVIHGADWRRTLAVEELKVPPPAQPDFELWDASIHAIEVNPYMFAGVMPMNRLDGEATVRAEGLLQMLILAEAQRRKEKHWWVDRDTFADEYYMPRIMVLLLIYASAHGALGEGIVAPEVVDAIRKNRSLMEIAKRDGADGAIRTIASNENILELSDDREQDLVLGMLSGDTLSMRTMMGKIKVSKRTSYEYKNGKMIVEPTDALCVFKAN